jgi:hypothetical protein
MTGFPAKRRLIPEGSPATEGVPLPLPVPLPVPVPVDGREESLGMPILRFVLMGAGGSRNPPSPCGALNARLGASVREGRPVGPIPPAPFPTGLRITHNFSFCEF